MANLGMAKNRCEMWEDFSHFANIQNGQNPLRNVRGFAKCELRNVRGDCISLGRVFWLMQIYDLIFYVVLIHCTSLLDLKRREKTRGKLACFVNTHLIVRDLFCAPSGTWIELAVQRLTARRVQYPWYLIVPIKYKLNFMTLLKSYFFTICV